MRILFILAFCGWSVARAQLPVRKVQIADLQEYIAKSDHPIIVTFWATFCTPCNKEIPYFQRTAARYRDRGVELILVSLDLPGYFPAKIGNFALSQGYTAATLMWLNERDADFFCPKVDPHWSGGIPASLFVDNKTHYRQFFDRQLTEPQVELEIKKMFLPAGN